MVSQEKPHSTPLTPLLKVEEMGLFPGRAADYPYIRCRGPQKIASQITVNDGVAKPPGRLSGDDQ